MATATAAPTHSQPATASASHRTHVPPRPPNPPQPSSAPSVYAAEVERDEAWVRQLQEEQQQRFAHQAELMHKEYLAELEKEGPFANAQTRTSLLTRYEERLEQMRAMQTEELEQHIELERQERLWSMGLEDGTWDGWNRLIQEQTAILANIKRSASIGTDATMQERIRENAREAEEVGRRSEEWQRTEPQRMADRARWAERTRLTNAHVGERRQRDIAEAEMQAAQTRAREEQLRETLAAQSETAPSSRPDSVFSAATGTNDTPPSSVFAERWRPSPAISIPSPADDARRSYNNDRPSPMDDIRRASPARPSPLSSTPTSSQTMAHAKAEEPTHPTVWIPPESTREPTRKNSTGFEGYEATSRLSGMFGGGEPTRKPSRVFDSREPARKLSGSFDGTEPGRRPSMSGVQEESARKVRQAPPPHQSQSQPQFQPPNAPPTRSAPLPTTQPSYTPSSQAPQSQSYQQPLRPTTQQRPAATSAFPPQPRGQETSTPTKATPLSSGTNAARPTPSPTTAYPAHTARAAPPPTSTKPIPKPTDPKGAQDPAEERRRELRDKYTREEAQRVEEERRRRDEETNRRRAEEARKRGAEKRRAEEEAREAERREAERREAERRARAGLPKMGPTVNMAELWDAYEKQWAAMASATQLRFRSIPWPISTQVLEPEGLIPVQIAAFILSPAHSQGKARKDRLKEALLRWHPDRFETKWLRKVVEEEREAVKEGVGLVVRALNELLSADGTFSA